MTSQLKASSLSCTRQHQLIFSDLSFEINAGEVLVVEGPNGSGKSSLLRLLTGLLLPTKGELHWQGKNITTQIESYRRQLHYLAHHNGLKLNLTIYENLALSSCYQQQFLKNCDEILSALNLFKERFTSLHQLSAGQKRRVALARLVLFPKIIWILDEPLTALDVETQNWFHKQLEKHLQSGGLAIISSHQSLSLTTIKSIRLRAC